MEPHLRWLQNVANIAGDTSSISDSLDVSEEDLKYLRDIAEQEAINRFTTAEIKVDMSGMSNTVHNTNDLDGIVDGLTTQSFTSDGSSPGWCLKVSTNAEGRCILKITNIKGEVQIWDCLGKRYQMA